MGLIAKHIRLDPQDVRPTPALRERYFGSLDLQSSTNYPRVWEHDAVSADHRMFGVESLMSVIRRTTAFIRRCERVHKNCIIALVSHGDSLQILQTAFARRDPREHRSLD